MSHPRRAPFFSVIRESALKSFASWPLIKGPVLFGSSAAAAHAGFERVHKEGVGSILDELYREFSTRPRTKRKEK